MIASLSLLSLLPLLTHGDEGAQLTPGVIQFGTQCASHCFLTAEIENCLKYFEM